MKGETALLKWEGKGTTPRRGKELTENFGKKKGMDQYAKKGGG